MRHERASSIAEGRHKWARPELIRTQKLNSDAELKFVNFFLILIANGSCLNENIIIEDKKRMKTFKMKISVNKFTIIQSLDYIVF